ncbi:LIPaSe related [Aphelenchoides fujianensis]|nr:LIPaSe related [Aphelenchoides fujianensis]
MSSSFPFLLLALPFASALFSADFRRFLVERHDEEAAGRLERGDLGAAGSFGGCEAVECAIPTVGRRPVVFVHGAAGNAGVFVLHAAFFRLGGYSPAELVATSLPDLHRVSCANVKQVRLLIDAVHAYSGSHVDVLAASMGAAVARKAFLGGRCADEDVPLGPPLTPLVHSFLAVDGVGRGAADCRRVIEGREDEFCDARTGIRPDSTVMSELSAQSAHFESHGRTIALFDPNDRLLGGSCGEHECMEIPTADFSLAAATPHHGWLTLNTPLLQLMLLSAPLNESLQAAAQMGFTIKEGTNAQGAQLLAVVQRTVGGDVVVLNTHEHMNSSILSSSLTSKNHEMPVRGSKLRHVPSAHQTAVGANFAQRRQRSASKRRRMSGWWARWTASGSTDGATTSRPAIAFRRIA